MGDATVPIDVDAARADTPSCLDRAYFENCGASLPPNQVVESVIDYLLLEARVGGYAAAQQRSADLDRVYGAGAKFLGCQPDEVAFTTSASDAWWRAFLSVPLVAGDRVLVGRTEYSANVIGLLQAADRGVEIEIVPDDEHGQIDLARLEDRLDERVKLVCLTTVAMSNGLVNPSADVGKLTKAVGAVYLVDACQAAGQISLDVDEIGCDFLTLTGRKFVRGPRGTGMLYARRSVLDDLISPPFLDGRSSVWTEPEAYSLEPGARRFEMFEVSYGAKVGFARALDYALDLGLDAIEYRVVGLAERLRSGLRAIDGIRVLDTGQRRCGIVTFDVAGCSANEVKAYLGERSVAIGAVTRSMSQLDLGGRSLSEVVRAGVHYFNTEDEVDRLVAEMETLRRT